MPPTRSKRTRQSTKQTEQKSEDETFQVDSIDEQETSPQPRKRARRSTTQSNKPSSIKNAMNDPDAIKIDKPADQAISAIVGLPSDLDDDDEQSNNQSSIKQSIHSTLSSVARTALSSNQSYFDITRRNRTSNRTLDQLIKPTVNQTLKYTPYTGGLEKLLHERLINHFVSQFKEWSLTLSSGMNVLLYGYGSKYQLIERFMLDWLVDGPLVVIAGFDQSFDLHAFLSLITTEVCMQQTNFKDIQSQLDFIEQFFQEQSNAQSNAQPNNQSNNQLIPHFTIVIHSIDGPALRSSIIQQTFAHLARCKSIRLLASCDTGRAPLLWAASGASSLKWASYEVPTFAPFSTELQTSARAKSESKVTLSSTRGVYAIMQSLTPMHRKVMTSLAKQFVQLLKENDTARAERKQAAIDAKKKKSKKGRKRKGKRSVNPDPENEDVVVEDTEMSEEHSEEADSDDDAAVTARTTSRSNTTRGVNCADFIASCQSELMASETSLQASMRELITHDLVLEKRGQRGESIYVIPGTAEEITRHFIDEPKPEDSDTRQIDDTAGGQVEEQQVEEEEDEIVQFW